MKYYRVKTGYGKDEFISIDETEVESAIRAQITGKIGVFKEGTISGNHIISITPDFNRVMEYKRDHQLSGEDYDHIGESCQQEHIKFFSETKDAIHSQLRTGNKLLS